jgi:hypothetical protein
MHLLPIGRQLIRDARFDLLAVVQRPCDHNGVKLFRTRLTDPTLLTYLRSQCH